MKVAWRSHTSESCSTRSHAARTTRVKRAGPMEVALCSAFLQDAHSHVNIANEAHQGCGLPCDKI